MVEKRIPLEHTSLRELLGAENRHIKKIAAAFPQNKLVARGEEILVKGPSSEIARIDRLISVLISHCSQYGELTEEQLSAYLTQDNQGISVMTSKENVIIHATGGNPIGTESENQRAFFTATQCHDLVFAVGPSGTGKTFLAVAIALRALRNKEVQRIIITRPAVEAGENLGFLPGDLKEKMDPYLQPVYDALRQILSEEKLRFFKEKGIIEIAPLAYMRGRTLSRAFVLLDEAQNATPMQLKMLLTRLGLQTKAIVTGDVSQIDLPVAEQSGLLQAMDYLKGVPGVGFVELEASDVMRHPLVKKIIEAYATHQDKKRRSSRS